jgi:succinate-semialdehyde dehydrogenase / glutarate-semialdehyde dehydrogenase
LIPYIEPKLHIDGQWLGLEGRRSLPIVNPANEQVLGHFPVATDEDLDRAVRSSVEGHKVWSAMSGNARGKVLLKAAEILRERTDLIAGLMTLEQGKPLSEAKGEISGVSDILEWDAAEGQRAYGRVIPSRVPEQRQLVVREPIGPVVVFTPWNYPALIVVRKISSVLASGCSCIIKVAEETASTGAEVVRAFVDAGLPNGVLNLVLGVPAHISDYLLRRDEIRGVAFTGSTLVGRQLSALAAQTFKRMVMELGGHGPVIVFDDASFVEVAVTSANRKYRNLGQGCINPCRYYVHESGFDAFLTAFVKVASGFRVGDGFSEGITHGPLAHDRRVAFMDELVADAVQKGGKLVCGGFRVGEKGYFWQPAVLADVPNTARIMNEEPFGPIAIINRFQDDQLAMAEANRLAYGLAAYAFTKSADRATWAGHALHAGMVGINTYFLGPPGSIGAAEPPFGGMGDSGYGCEGGIEGLTQFTDIKFISQF